MGKWQCPCLWLCGPPAADHMVQQYEKITFHIMVEDSDGLMVWAYLALRWQKPQIDRRELYPPTEMSEAVKPAILPS